MKSVFEELEVNKTYIDTHIHKFNNKDWDISINGIDFVTVMKNMQVIKRFKILDMMGMEEHYSNISVKYVRIKASAISSFIDNSCFTYLHKRYYFPNKETFEAEERIVSLGKPKYDIIKDYPVASPGEFLQFIGNGKMMDSFSTSSKINFKTYNAESAIVYAQDVIKPNFHSKNKKFNEWSLWDAAHTLSPIKQNKGKLNKSEMSYMLCKKINKIELV